MEGTGLSREKSFHGRELSAAHLYTAHSIAKEDAVLVRFRCFEACDAGFYR